MAQGEEKTNPFVLDGIHEEFSIGGHKLVLRPLSMKKVQQLVEAVEGAVSGIDPLKPETFRLGDMTNRFAGKARECLRIVFPQPQFDFMTEDFIAEHFTVPAYQKLAERVVLMNGLESFFPNLLPKKEAVPSKAGGASITS
jgi:hypothetical protein